MEKTRDKREKRTEFQVKIDYNYTSVLKRKSIKNTYLKKSKGSKFQRNINIMSFEGKFLVDNNVTIVETELTT